MSDKFKLVTKIKLQLSYLYSHHDGSKSVFPLRPRPQYDKVNQCQVVHTYLILLLPHTSFHGNQSEHAQ